MLKKKVVFYLNMFLIGGIETSMIRYLKAIDKSRFDVTLLIGIGMKDFEVLIDKLPSDINVKYIYKDNEYKIDYFYNKRKKNNKIFDKLIEVFYSPIRKYNYYKQLTHELNQYDVVIDYAMGLIELSKNISTKLIGFFHFSLEKNYLTNQRKTKLFSQNIVNYTKLITLNQSMYNEFKNYFPQKVKHVEILYNQFDFNEIHSLAQSGIVNSDYADYMVSVGRLEENQKDFTTLIRAFAKICDKTGVNLVIVGDGNDRGRLQDLILELGLTERIFLVGHQSNPFMWIINSLFFVFSSKYEGLPTVLIEAMILNKAVISTNCPTGPYEITNGGECGILTDVGNVDQLAFAMYQLSTNFELKNQLVEKANMELDRFDINKNIKRLEELFV